MPRYKVTLEEMASYEIEVEADDAESAKEAAEETFVQSDNINQYFSHVSEREVANVEEIEGAPASFEYERWRHGGWYVVNVRYPSGAVGCVSRNYPDRKWRIACDPRPFEERPTFHTRDEAARAEWEGIRSGELLKQIPETPTQPGATPA
jgi:hypothetical protein